MSSLRNPGSPNYICCCLSTDYFEMIMCEKRQRTSPLPEESRNGGSSRRAVKSPSVALTKPNRLHFPTIAQGPTITY